MAPSALSAAARLIAFALLALAAAPLDGADLSRLAPFVGAYTIPGEAIVTNGRDKPVKGTATMQFTLAKNGKSARLKIRASLDVPGDVDNGIQTSLILRTHHRSMINNLAPGFVDRRYAAGRYVLAGHRILASSDFSFERAHGRATFHVTLRRYATFAQLTVTQTLVSSELPTLVRWRFQARAPR